MTGPALPTPGVNPSLAIPMEFDFDEMEAANKPEAAPTAPTPPADATAFRFEGDAVPESIRGLSAAQIAERAVRLEEALKISEAGRLRPAAAPTPVAAPAAPAPSVTVEDIKARYEENPLEAMAMLVELGKRQALQEFEARVGPLAHAARTNAEAQARAAFKQDFDDFGPQIDELVAKTDPRVLNDPNVWDGIVSYVRGKNVDKLIERKVKEALAAAPAASRAAAQEASLASLPPRVPRAGSTSGTTDETYGLDEVQQKIAKTMGISLRDYKKNM